MIRVTMEDIREANHMANVAGRFLSSEDNPVAVAIRRHHPEFKRITINGHVLSVCTDKYRAKYDLPDQVAAYLRVVRFAGRVYEHKPFAFAANRTMLARRRRG